MEVKMTYGANQKQRERGLFPEDISSGLSVLNSYGTIGLANVFRYGRLIYYGIQFATSKQVPVNTVFVSGLPVPIAQEGTTNNTVELLARTNAGATYAYHVSSTGGLRTRNQTIPTSTTVYFFGTYIAEE